MISFPLDLDHITSMCKPILKAKSPAAAMRTFAMERNIMNGSSPPAAQVQNDDQLVLLDPEDP